MFKKQIPSKNIPKKLGSTNMKPYWDVIRDIIKESDIVLEVLDARMPDISRNDQLEELVREYNKELVFILNKADLVDKQTLNKRYFKLKKESNCFIISNKEKMGTKRLREWLISKAKPTSSSIKRENQEFKIGILGYPNTGKSSVINSISKASKVKVSSKAGTTHGQQWINIWKNIKLIDSPGVIPLRQDDEIRQALIASKNPEKIHNLELVAYEIIKLFPQKTSLENFYLIKIPKDIEDNPDEIIKLIGEKKGFIKKQGLVEINRVCIQIIR
ncbi:MAG: GTPase, partial [Nanoarchaeota archaeon]